MRLWKIAMISIDEKVVIVTGGGNGIGKAFCLALAGAGGKVCVADIDAAGAREVAAGILQGGWRGHRVRSRRFGRKRNRGDGS